MNRKERQMSDANDKAAKLFSEYRSTVLGIRGNRSASREGKRQSLARTYLNARQRMDAIFTEQAAGRAQLRRDLESKLFGTRDLPGDVASMTISRRDAGDRVARLERSEDAMALLRRALASGDEVLARAVAQWGHERRDVTVVNAYLDVRPQHDAAFNELWKLPASDDDPIQAASRYMHYPIDKPSELDDVAEMHLQAVADGRELQAA